MSVRRIFTLFWLCGLVQEDVYLCRRNVKIRGYTTGLVEPGLFSAACVGVLVSGSLLLPLFMLHTCFDSPKLVKITGL